MQSHPGQLTHGPKGSINVAYPMQAISNCCASQRWPFASSTLTAQGSTRRQFKNCRQAESTRSFNESSFLRKPVTCLAIPPLYNSMLARGYFEQQQPVSTRLLVSAAASRGSGGAGLADPPPEPFVEHIEERELHVEASESYLAYAMSVIVGRALPDVRDGLKPVHRRILFAMHDLGLAHNKPYRKCARVVGEVLGKYHPHGDSAVYDALVRLAQDFSMRHPLIAGHGNFGSLDDDPPAAMRYTECRLQSLAADMLLTNLDEKVVKFVPTFDGSQDEPSVLPANIPHLLVNGTNGIAVGIATRIPPHNLKEVVAGLSAFIKNQDITNEELRQFVPGPDFPTGGVIGVGQGLVDAYETGSGSVLLRAKVNVEEGEDGAPSGSSKSRTRSRRPTATNIVISEVPFQTSKAELVVKIAELVEAKTLEGVVDVRDESDRQGLRVVVELKPGVSSDVVLAGLYKHTRLESRVPCNMVALVDGAPKQLALRDFFKHFLAFRCDILIKRAQNQLGKAQDRLHLVSGFLAAMARLDDVVQLIREAKDTAAARAALMNDIQLSVTQADATLALPLRRLTSMERSALEGELKQVSASIADLEDFLARPERILALVDSEAQAVAAKHGTPRKSVIISEEEASGKVAEAAATAAAAAAAASEVLLMASARRFVHRVPSAVFEAQNRGGKGKLGAGLREGDCLTQVVRTTEGNRVLVVTSTGHAYSIPAAAIPPPSRSGYGSAIAQVLNTASSVPMVALVPLKPQPPPNTTPAGPSTASSPPQAAPAAQPNSAAQPAATADRHEASSSGDGGSDICAQRTEGDEAEGHAKRKAAAGDQFLLLLTVGGNIKRTPLTSNYYKTTKSGFSVMKMDSELDPVGWAASCGLHDFVLLASSSGRLLSFPVSQIPQVSRQGGSVKGMKLQDGHRVVGMTLVPSSVASSSISGGLVELPGHRLSVLLVTAGGKGKRISLPDLRMGNRGTMGSPCNLNARGTEGDTLAALALVNPNDEVLLGSVRGKIMRLQASSVEVASPKNASRVLMDLHDGDSVQTIAVIPTANKANDSSSSGSSSD